jgi:hypothetical protein
MQPLHDQIEPGARPSAGPFADDPHGARLWTLLARLFCELDRRPDLQAVEGIVEHAVAVKVQLAPIGRLDEAVRPLREEPADSGERPQFVHFHGAALPPRLIFQAAAGGVERIADGHVYVLMRVVLGRLAAHDEFIARHRQVDANMVELALMVAAMRRLDHHPAAHDAVAEAFEAGYMRAYVVFDSLARRYAAEADL